MGLGVVPARYSYDVLDNGRRPSAERIIPELQKLAVGMIFPALPGAADGFTVLAFEPQNFSSLVGRHPMAHGSCREVRPRRWRARLDAPSSYVHAPDRDTVSRAAVVGDEAHRGERFTSSCSGNNCSVSPGASSGAHYRDARCRTAMSLPFTPDQFFAVFVPPQAY